jgi:uncharacterized protein (TIGR00299 family) protein
MIAYFHCFSGISGDMVLGALLDLGLKIEKLEEELRKLPLEGYSLSGERVSRGGITGVRFRVNVREEQPSRDYEQIQQMIEQSGLLAEDKDLSLRIFHRLADAEAQVHGVGLKDVHFHEVGAVDSIVDIVGAAIGLRDLGIRRVLSSPLTVGSGFVQTSHGPLPLPAPATARLLVGVPIRGSKEPGERVTPTGAAILTALAESYGPVPFMTLKGVGHGAGAREYQDAPNLLRVLLGDAQETWETDRSAVVETNLDDMSPEWYGFLMERLFNLGVQDVFFSPIQMKKNRPGTLVRVICSEHLREEVVRLLFMETTTIGIRYNYVDRIKLPRAQGAVQTPFGELTVKVITGVDGQRRLVPEYESCARAAREKGVSLREVYEAALTGAAMEEEQGGGGRKVDARPKKSHTEDRRKP